MIRTPGAERQESATDAGPSAPGVHGPLGDAG